MCVRSEEEPVDFCLSHFLTFSILEVCVKSLIALQGCGVLECGCRLVKLRLALPHRRTHTLTPATADDDKDKDLQGFDIHKIIYIGQLYKYRYGHS